MLYACLVCTRTVTVVWGVALAVATSALQYSIIYSSTGSTAAIGLLFWPSYLVLLAAIGAAVDQAVQHLAGRRVRSRH